MNNIDVAFYKMETAEYGQVPFNPAEIYPEVTGLSYKIECNEKNEVYGAVRQVLYHLGCDQSNFGTAKWNPLGEFVKSGQKVLLKPNLVYHQHPLGDQDVLGMVTNAAVLRPLIDYVLLATGGDVQITIADAPVQGANFEKVISKSGVLQLVEFYKQKGIAIQLVDMRMIISEKNSMDILSRKYDNPTRNAEMYITVDLKEKTELYEVIEKSKRFEITDYGYGSVNKHHNKVKNEYKIPCEVLEADLIINVPKLKTHRKAGVTCAMKNLVGVNGDKTCLAHHTRGVKKEGGDEFSKSDAKTWVKVRVWTFLKTSSLGIKIASAIKWFFQKTIWKGKTMKEHNMQKKPDVFFEGNWHGNDTIWRCVKDLNKIVLFADKKGNMQNEQQRKYLCIVDAVLAGEGEGPMEQTTKKFGVVFGGTNPVYIDYTATRLMKFDYRNVPLIKNGFLNKWWNLVEKQPKEVTCAGNAELAAVAEYFTPSFGWQDALKEHVD